MRVTKVKKRCKKRERRKTIMAVLATKNPRPFVAKSSNKKYIMRSKVSARKQRGMMKQAEIFEKSNIRVVHGDIDTSTIKWGSDNS